MQSSLSCAHNKVTPLYICKAAGNDAPRVREKNSKVR